MPLDTGGVTHELLMSAGVDMGDDTETNAGAIDVALSIGAAFRTTRQRLGYSLQDISDATRIKRAYLEALEDMRLEELPSRPFTIGYVRAFARALGLDPEAAVARFKADAPNDVEPLRPPVGVRKHKDARLALLAGGGAVVVTAVLVWNLAQHAMNEDTPPPPAIAPASEPATPQPTPASAQPVSITQALPAPQESDLPQPYATPGLPASGDAAAGSASGAPTGASLLAASTEPAPPQTFIKRGQVYGDPSQPSTVILQARKSASLVVRAPDGKVVFAGVLKAGESYRAPSAGGLSLDVSDTTKWSVYVNNQLGADLTATVMPFSKIAPAASAAAASPPAAG